MSSNNKDLLLLFDRPQEPIFMGKGENQIVFDMPDDFLVDRYKPIGPQLLTRFQSDAVQRVQLKQIQKPDLSEILDISRSENFSLFLPKHRRIAGRLINIFLNAKDVQELKSVAVYVRDRINPYLFNYGLSVAILHRPDTKDLDVPSFIQSFPDKYFDSKVFNKAREECVLVEQGGSRIPIEIPMDYTASNLEIEQRVAYFREDLGINLHHWHWHLVYPFEGDASVVAKNRRGELFYYMHQQIMARYNFERLCNQMRRVTRLNDLRVPIEEAYFPKMNSLVASRSYPARVANQTLKDINREADQIRVDIDDMYRWRDRIFMAIHSGSVIDSKGNRIRLTENEGIDILGNIIESCSILSPNPTFYGDLHNMGHTMLSYIHDPDHRHLESFGVIGDSATAMRDPIFYRWHAYLDAMFQEFKESLPRYEESRLNYEGVIVTDVTVKSDKSADNTLSTFWQQSDVNLSSGMDFLPRGSVFARFTHLQHRPFTYQIKVTNNSVNNKMGTCRIFMAPKFDERGNSWLFTEQKNMFIELDRFVVTLRQGENVITRKSSQSSVTIPFERTFRNLNLNTTDAEARERFNYCGCGWPEHMLIPKGTPQGFPCHLFVMISNYDDDNVAQDNCDECDDAMSYCGLRSKLYPDRRSMGYPFDRMPREGVDTLRQFLTPNMRVQEVNISFNK